MNFPSTFGIGDRVAVQFDGGENDGTRVIGYIRAVIFSSSKVRYSVVVITGRPEGSLSAEQMKARLLNEEEPPTGECWFTLHNVDSCLIKKVEGKSIEMPSDIYS